VKYLSELLVPKESELEFWTAFRNKEYRPELLFTDDEVLARISTHPMALWKCGGRDRTQFVPEQ